MYIRQGAKALISSSIVVLLSACGGGSNSDLDPANADPASTYNVSGSVNNLNGSLVLA